MEEKEIIEIVNKANINVNNHLFGEKCEKCNSCIMPSIHHYIDQFYKEIIYKINEKEKEGSK